MARLARLAVATVWKAVASVLTGVAAKCIHLCSWKLFLEFVDPVCLVLFETAILNIQ